jgi:toxin ParE1/3/4
MAYQVRITSRAERDLAQIYDDINAPGSEAARRWYAGLKQSILSLEQLPNRCAATPESRKFRHLLFGDKVHVYRYRVLKREKFVEILHIRHGAQRRFTRSELEENF